MGSDFKFDEFKARLDTLAALMKHLGGDVDQFKEDNTQLGRRALARSVFSFIEGTSFAYKAAAADLAALTQIEMTEGERLLSLDVAYRLDDTGQVQRVQPPLATIANIRFALNLFAKAIGLGYRYPAHDVRHGQLLRAQGIRNRLAHPRRVEDLSVDDEERQTLIVAFDWVIEQQGGLLKAICYHMALSFETFRRQAKDLLSTEGPVRPEPLLQLMTDNFRANGQLDTAAVDKWFEEKIAPLAELVRQGKEVPFLLLAPDLPRAPDVPMPPAPPAA